MEHILTTTESIDTKGGNDEEYEEDAQLLHKCMTRKIKRDDDSDYDPSDHSGGEDKSTEPAPPVAPGRLKKMKRYYWSAFKEGS
jgi:hypothetical protein